ncbi:MAG TPA: hypothetical protein VH105_11785 [Burkholderiales bacterium]|nr:hypothetical protein [Burkholderiales bacterium]
MTKETVASFVLAVCVVGGSMFGFVKLGGLGGLPQARAATQPAASTAPPPAAAAAPQQGDFAQSARVEAQQAQVDAPEDEAAAAAGKPRCKAISHQITGIDGALISPLSTPVRDFYTKQRKSLRDEQAGLDC